MPAALLDTNAVSDLMRGHPQGPSASTGVAGEDDSRPPEWSAGRSRASRPNGQVANGPLPLLALVCARWHSSARGYGPKCQRAKVPTGQQGHGVPCNDPSRGQGAAALRCRNFRCAPRDGLHCAARTHTTSWEHPLRALGRLAEEVGYQGVRDKRYTQQGGIPLLNDIQ